MQTPSLDSTSTIEIGSKEIIFNSVEQSLDGVISGSGGKLTCDNGAAARLSANNTYTGDTTIKNSSGLVLTADSNLGASSGNILVIDGGSLEVPAGFSTARTIDISSGGVFFLGGGSGAPIVFSGPITGSGNASIDVNNNQQGDFLLSGNLSFSHPTGTLQIGCQSLTLSNPLNSFEVGSIFVRGELKVSNDGNLGNISNPIRIDGYGLFNFTAPFTTNRNFLLDDNTGFNQSQIKVESGVATIAGVISNGEPNSTLVKLGPGTLDLQGVNTYTSGTRIDEGTLSISGAGSLESTGSVNVNSSTSIFDISSISSSSLIIGGLDGVADSQVNLGTKDLIIGDNFNTPSYAGTIVGTGALRKDGGGFQELTGTNSYSGGTYISLGGVLSVTSDASLGDSSSDIFIDIGFLEFTGSTSLPRQINIGAVGFISIVGDGTIVTANGPISGGTLFKQGSGKFILNTANTYSGTSIASGTLSLTGSGTAGGASQQVQLVSSNAIFDISEITPASANIGVISGASGSMIELGSKNLNTNVNADTSYNGSINGDGGSLTKQGSAKLTLTGVNTYTGGTIIADGTLSLIGSGTVGAPASPINLTSNTAIFDISTITTSVSMDSITGVSGSLIQLGGKNLTTNTSSNTTYNGSIAGLGGSLTKAGTGVLTFDGSAKTYTGGTSVSGGTLQLQAGNQMAGTINNSAILDIEANALETYAGQITGTGILNVNNGGATGVAILSNATNNYSGATNVVRGTLRAGAAGAFSPATSVTLGNGTTSGILDLNNFANSVASIHDSVATPGSVLLSGDLTLTGPGITSTFNGTINGAATLILNGASSNLTLAGTNTCSAQINQGTLTGNTATLPQTIGTAATGTLVINEPTTSTLTGTITGTGNVNKQGAGTLFLTTGPTNVAGFTGLYNALAGVTKLNTTIGGSITVHNTATLSGTGTVGGNLIVQNGATIAPGNSIGTITVLGNYTQNAGSTYLVEIDGLGNSTRIDVSGTATLNGGLVSITSNDGVLAENVPYTILHADGGLSGTFASATATGFAGGAAGIPLLSYTATDALFMFASQSALPIGTTPNQRAVARQFSLITSPTSDQSDVLMNLIALSPAAQDAALDAIAGEQYTNYLNMSEMSNRQFLRRLYDPIQQLVTTSVNECCAQCPHFNAVWIEGGATRSSFKGNINASGYKTHGYELAGGLQAYAGENLVIGAAGGYSKDMVHFNQYATGKNSTAFGGIYTLYRPQGFYVFADAAYSYSANRISRLVQFGSIDRTAKGAPKISQTTFYAEGGVDFNLAKILVQPFIGLEADYFFRQTILEKGADSLNLKIYSQTRQKTFSRLGVHLTSNELPYGFSFNVDLAWQYRLTSLKNQIDNRFEQFGEQFVILGVEPSRNAFEGAVTLACQANDRLRFFVEFSGERWNRANAYSALAGLETSW